MLLITLTTVCASCVFLNIQVLQQQSAMGQRARGSGEEQNENHNHRLLA